MAQMFCLSTHSVVAGSSAAECSHFSSNSSPLHLTPSISKASRLPPITWSFRVAEQPPPLRVVHALPERLLFFSSSAHLGRCDQLQRRKDKFAHM